MLKIINKEKTMTNDNVMVIQSKLFAPTYSGPGKWIIYNTDTNKGMLAVGKDRLPDIIPILTKLSDPKNDYRKIADASTIERLKSLGLAVNKDVSSIDISTNSYLKLYQNAVFNYPFRDYSEEDWLKKDNATMDYYNKLWEHPNAFTKRTGKRIKLAEVADEEIGELKGNEITKTFLSYLLKTTFGSLGTIKNHPIDSYRRTSPSGGAKHPTEAQVYLHEALDDLEKGSYIYDVEHHALIRDKSCDECFEMNIYEKSFSIMLRSRVERPMWRYREIRSYRAILIDAGHILETIMQLSGTHGLYTKNEHISLGQIQNSNFEWIKEPPISVVHISTQKNPSIINKIRKSNDAKILKGKEYLTNPSTYFTFKNGTLMANILWPKEESFPISFTEFELFTHCLSSRRGDRNVTYKGITYEYSIKTPRMDEIIEKGFLLPKTIASSFYHELNLWVQHNWYLNFLMYLGTHNDNPTNLGNTFRNKTIEISLKEFKERKTCRDFSTKEISLAQLTSILDTLQNLEECRFVDLYINIQRVTGLECGLYKLEQTGLTRIGESINSDEIQSLVIGQEWTGTGAVDVFLKTKADLNSGETYHLNMIRLGQIGQRIIMAATALGLGAFMTPAAKDKEIINKLLLEVNNQHVFYYIGVGYANGK